MDLKCLNRVSSYMSVKLHKNFLQNVTLIIIMQANHKFERLRSPIKPCRESVCKSI